MANELRYIGTVTDGQLKLSHRKQFDADLAGFEGSRVIVSLKKYRKSRSNKQNAYYHGCIIPYVRDGLVDMGFEAHLLSSENVHELLKDKFLKEDISTPEGEFIAITRSTADLSTTEFMDFIADIQKWASEFLGIVIPDPGRTKRN